MLLGGSTQVFSPPEKKIHVTFKGLFYSHKLPCNIASFSKKFVLQGNYDTFTLSMKMSGIQNRRACVGVKMA